MLDRSTPPHITPIQSIELLNPKSKHLSNGITIFYLPDNSLDVVVTQLIINAGSLYQDKIGQASLTAKMLQEGTTTRSSKEISNFLSDNGAFLDVSSSRENIKLELSCLSRLSPKLVDLLADLVINPTFPENELSRQIAISEQSLAVNLNKPTTKVTRKLNTLLYGEEHTYSQAANSGDYKKLSKELLRSYHAKYFIANNINLFITGNTSDELINHYAKTLEKIPQSGSTYSYTFQDIHQNNTIEIIREEDAEQDTLRLAQHLFPRGHQDEFDLKIANTLLGGFFGSRLMKNLREEKGYTYGIFSQLSQDLHQGIQLIGGSFTLGKGEEAISEIFREMDLLKDQPISDDELLIVKNYITGNFANNTQTPFAHMDRFRTLHYNNLDENYFNKFIERVNSISAEALKQIAQKYFNRENYSIVLLTK